MDWTVLPWEHGEETKRIYQGTRRRERIYLGMKRRERIYLGMKRGYKKD